MWVIENILRWVWEDSLKICEEMYLEVYQGT